MKKMVISLCFISSIAAAAKLEDVRILNINSGRENFELKLQTKDGPKDSFFYVDIVKADAESFEKMVHVFNKLMKKDKYKLDLDVPSFSDSPSGSYYKSDGITFSTPAEREPDSVKNIKKKKK